MVSLDSSKSVSVTVGLCLGRKTDETNARMNRPREIIGQDTASLTSVPSTFIHHRRFYGGWTSSIASGILPHLHSSPFSLSRAFWGQILPPCQTLSSREWESERNLYQRLCKLQQDFDCARKTCLSSWSQCIGSPSCSSGWCNCTLFAS